MQLFRKNKAVIDFEKANYDFVKLRETIEYGGFEEQVVIVTRRESQYIK